MSLSVKYFDGEFKRGEAMSLGVKYFDGELRRGEAMSLGVKYFDGEFKRGEAPLKKMFPPSPYQGSCLKCHSEERSNEESMGGAGGTQVVFTTPRPFATLRVTGMQFF